MNECTKCLYPSTRPDLFLNDGVCDACNSAMEKEKIDWVDRERELVELLNKYRRTDGHYDCVIPVSGGKDSTFQVIKMLEYGMHPLCVTFAQCEISPEGQKNLDNIAEMGVDHIIFRPNRKVYKQLFRKSFEKLGDACWPCHVGIFTYPIRVAVQYGIPLIVWGENSQLEYGGPASAKANNCLTNTWLQEFGGMQGMRVTDWVNEGIDWKDLYPYVYPTDEELKDTTGIFLGYYVKWDARKQLEAVEKTGFVRRKAPNNAYLDYENVDCGFVDMHDHLMYKKYGFGRATTQLSIDIRNGRITREKAEKLAKDLDGKEPNIKAFCKFTGLSDKMVKDTIEKFRNKAL
jgi:N-acetyl sugar amidotransferase